MTSTDQPTDNCSCSPRYNPDCAYMKGGYCIDPGRVAAPSQPTSPSGDAETLTNELLAFYNFVNEPPQYEDQRMVRDYRHELARLWSPLCLKINAALSAPCVDPVACCTSHGMALPCPICAHFSAPRVEPVAGDNVQIDELAAWLCALEDADSHKLIPESLIERGRRYIYAGVTEEHCGDCTKQSHSCVVCGTDGYRLHAKQMLLHFSALAAPPSQPDTVREALETIRRYTDENLGPSRSSLLNKIAQLADEALAALPPDAED
jgi:hypothetical protein